MKKADYYGGQFREILLAAGVVMVLTMPFFSDQINKPILFSILIILALVIISGLVNPLQKNFMIFSLAVAATAFAIFHYSAVDIFKQEGIKDAFFVVNEILALMFLVSIYYGTQSLKILLEEK